MIARMNHGEKPMARDSLVQSSSMAEAEQAPQQTVEEGAGVSLRCWGD